MLPFTRTTFMLFSSNYGLNRGRVERKAVCRMQLGLIEAAVRVGCVSNIQVSAVWLGG